MKTRSHTLASHFAIFIALSIGAAMAVSLHAARDAHAEPGEHAHTAAADDASPASPAGAVAEEATTIHVYKTPTCGCCTKWIDHLKEAGFDVKATELADLDEVKAMNGVPHNLSSCHTALVDGYVIEGHVPASDVAKLLNERPKVAGLAVPGMPMGSPGMEHSDPSRHEAYDVVSFGTQGIAVYSSHSP